MQDELFNRPDARINPAASVSIGDATGGLEPLAVPFARIGAILLRHLWVIVLVFLFGVSSTGIVVTKMAKRYTAEVSILVEPSRLPSF